MLSNNVSEGERELGMKIKILAMLYIIENKSNL